MIITNMLRGQGRDKIDGPSEATMLTGSELLAKVKELGDANKSDLVRACGYVSTKKDGTERLNFTAFYEALLTAKGIEVGVPSKGSRGPGGRKLSYKTKVQFNGNLLVGKAYTTMLDLQPGDEFQIKLGRKGITLTPIAKGSEGDSENEGFDDGDDAIQVPSEEEQSQVFGVNDVEVPFAGDLVEEEELVAA